MGGGRRGSHEHGPRRTDAHHFQRAAAAFLAISARRFLDRDAARALPPFSPPFRPSATAAGSFPSSVLGSSTAPVAMSVMNLASWLASLGRLLERLGIRLGWVNWLT